MIKLCVFDMDGTLLDSERELYMRSGLKVSKELGKPVSAEFLTKRMGGSYDDYKVELRKEYGEDFPVEEYFDRYWKSVTSIMLNESISLRPGVKQILDYCKNNNIKMAIGTTTASKLGSECLKRSGIADYFDYVLYGDFVEKKKPDPETYLRVVDHFDVDKSEALIFEDGHNGAQSAINGNLRLVLIKDLAFLSEEDIEKSELCVDDISKAIDLIRKENETTSGI